MNPTPVPPVTSPTAPPVSGAATACLVLGILAVCFSFLLVGGILGLVGLILGIIHLCRKRSHTAMAWWGFSLSLLGVLASIGLGVFYYQVYRHVSAAMESTVKEAALTEWEGATAPDFTFTTLEGKTIRLSEFKGKRVVLDFWATWCPPCRKEIPHLIRLVNDTSREDFVAVGISDEEEDVLRPFVKNNGMNYHVARADKLPPPYDSIQSIPTTLFIDRRGVIQKVLVGYQDFDTLKSYALQKDSEGPPKAQPAPLHSGLRRGAHPLSTELTNAMSGQAGVTAENSAAIFQQRVLAFNKRTLTDAYQQVGVRDPKWDDLVIQYLDNHAQRFTDPHKAPPAESVLAAGMRILELGCTDPLVLYCHGVVQDSCNDPAGAEKSFSPAATRLLASKYPAIRRRFAATRIPLYAGSMWTSLGPQL